ncbi:MAG: S8 family serine peptidase [Planctomycetota bacterium]|nr:S8 family serine peptidase [Planctomycetota bacterium]
MNPVRSNDATAVVFELLEPRLLLSTSVTPVLEAPGFGVPAYVDVVLPDHKLDTDIVSACLREAHADLEAEGDGVIDLVGSLQLAGVRVNEAGELQVYVHVNAVNASTIRALESAGLRIESSNIRMKVVEGWLPHTNLDVAAAVEGVVRIAPPVYAVTNTGGVTTAGDAGLNADDLRALFGGITGDGIKVGVISNGADNWGDVVSSGDLPNSITIDPSLSGSGDEGTAMLEIVHDIAPGAELYFSGPSNSVDMVDSIDWLVNTCGVDIIVDDLYFLDQPMFEDGAIADEVADAVAGGVTYVTCAGNYAEQHYQADYDQFDSTTTHDFGFGNLLPVAVSNGGTIRAVLEWSDEWGGSGNDYDLYLYGRETGQAWELADNGDAFSENVQNGNDDPWEFIEYTNDEGYDYLAFVFNRWGGADRELEFYVYGPALLSPVYVTPGDSIYGHAAVESVITVGAIDASDEDGLSDVESYSSQGHTTIYTNFSTQAWTTRDSLDVCGVDGVQTKIGQLGHFSNPFYGTSAAAPHIAGIAALLLQIDPTLTPAEIQDLITGNAADIGASGYDDVSGYGRADALATVTAAATAVDLKAASDTGLSSTDDLTKLDNTAGKTLQFDVTGTIAGATVSLYKGDDEIGSAVASGTTTTVTTNGTYDLADGQNAIAARQALTGKLESPSTASLTITVDTAAPTADVTDVSPDPRQDSVSYITLIFSEAVSGFGLGDLALTRDGGSNLLTVSQSLSSSDNITWTLSGLSAITDKAGRYELKLTAAGSGITDSSGNDLAADASDTWHMNAVNGTSGADTITISWDGTASRAEIEVNQEAAYYLDLSGFPVLNINGLTGDDTLTVDLSDGNPIPAAGIAFDGGDDTDTLKIVGTSNADVLNYTTTQAVLNPSGINAIVNFTGVEKHEVDLGGGSDTIMVGSQADLDFANDVGAGSPGNVMLNLAASAQATFESNLTLAALVLGDGSTVTLAPGVEDKRVLVTGSLEIAGGATPTATLDLNDNLLAINYTGASPMYTVRAQIVSAYNGGDWSGQGITSSLLDGGSTTNGIAYAFNGESAVWFDSGTPFANYAGADSTTVLVRYALIGDVNLDGTVDDSDISILSNNYGFTDQSWANGDVYGYDGIVSDDDVGLQANNYGLTV